MLSNKSIQDSNSAVPAVKNESAAPDMPLLASGRKKRWSHGSLFFSLFFFVPLIISRPLPIETWVLQTLGYLSFVILYIKAINQPVKTLPTYLLLMFLLSVACSFQNPGGATIIGFIAFIVGYYNSLKTGIMSIGVMML
ncbi:MAG: histidine kinase, partial [Pseudomonadota bacterium]|nr:histidine kinase [Pseudomonadota bacterium]